MADLTQPIAARFAHELSGPIGAALHALELLEIHLLTLFSKKENELWRAGLQAENRGNGETGVPAEIVGQKLPKALAHRYEQAFGKNAAIASLTKGAAEAQLDRLLRIFELAYDFRCAKLAQESTLEIIKDLRNWGSQSQGAFIFPTLQMAWTLAGLEFPELVLSWRIPEKLPVIKGNPSALMQLWMNLFRNAAQVNGGKAALEVSAFCEGKDVCIRIANEGKELPKNLRLFEEGQTAREGGTGLGLSYCRKIVEEHGGAIEAANRCDGPSGVVFAIRLPIALEASPKKV